ncbi:MAG: hypothetical protein N2109_01665 [Fimbriimonadales bacterium]|nr:hypothetical protein [Fimbriimonadales bacterium]
MTAALLALNSFLQPPAWEAYRIDLSERPFLLEGPRVCFRLEPKRSEQEPSDAPREVVLRDGDRFCVWGADGLRTRAGRRLFRWSFESDGRPVERKDGFPLVDSVRPEPALSGSARDGSLVYLLVRWDHPATAKREVLYVVDLAEARPHPRKLAESPGRSLAAGPIADRLHLVGGRATWIARQAEGSWGVCSWDPLARTSVYQPLGEGLVQAWSLSGRIQLFLERSRYGTNLLGRVDLLLGRRRELLESRQTIAPLPSAPERYAVEGERTLRDLATGATATLPGTFEARPTPFGLLVWWPGDTPEAGVLLGPNGLPALATWSRR